jgi:colanic acid biosynthesis glycosyl transferase WcaI
MPYYPQWEIWPDYRGRLWSREEHQGVAIYRSWHFVRPRVSSVMRIMHEASLSLMAIPNVFRVLRRAKVVYIASPALSYAFTGSILAKLLGVKRVLIVKDVMPDAAVELGMLKNKTVIAVSRWIARRAYALADEIHTLGEGMRKRIARATEQREKIRIVPDTVDGDELAPVPREDNEFRKRFVPDGTFAVLHTGNMGKKQDLDLVLRTADRLRDNPDIRFYVFGDGAVKPTFLKRREELGLDNVEHFPLQERWLLPHMLSGADVLLINQLPEVVDIVVPSKLLTALAAGAMIVAACADDSETAKLVRASGGGLIVPASDEVELAKTILAAQRGEVDAADYRKRARAFALETFDRAAVYGRLVDELESQQKEHQRTFEKKCDQTAREPEGRDER